jgi:hypothetical protein
VTNEPILLPLAPDSIDSEFPQVEKYRGIVEEALFDRLGRPSFFDEAVEVVQRRVAVRMEQHGIANRKSTSCPFAPQGDWIRGVAAREARRLVSEIELRFVETGKLEMPA